MPKIPNLSMEIELQKRGFSRIVGIDEVGRGALAGPMHVGACILQTNKRFTRIKDSKLLSQMARNRFYNYIAKRSVSFAVGSVEPQEIDAMGVTKALHLACMRALSGLETEYDYVLTDAIHLKELSCPYEAIIKGDEKVTTIAAASIIAKVTRDKYMRQIAPRYKTYDFKHNVGYGAPKHKIALQQHGPTDIHRMLYLRKFFKANQNKIVKVD